MTVAATTNRKTYTGDNVTTSFATSPVIFYLSSNLQVRVTVIATGVSTLLTENTHYTVSGGAATGATGTVNLAGGSSPHGALLSTEKLVILRALPLTQASDFVNNNNSDAEVLEAALDKLTDVDQQIQEQADRSVRFASGDVSGSATEIPDVTTRAGRLLGFDAAGLLTTVIVTAGTSLVDFASSVGATLIGFLQAGTGAVLRTLLAKLRETPISPQDFGALGNGVANDSAAFALWLTAIKGKKGIIPAGNYILQSEWTAFTSAWNGTTIEGESRSATILTFKNLSGKKCISLLDAAAGIGNIELRRFTVLNSGSTTTTGLNLDGTDAAKGVSTCKFSELTVSGFANNLTTGYTFSNEFSNCEFYGSTAVNAVFGAQTNNNTFNGTHFVGGTQAFTCTNCEGLQFNTPNISNQSGATAAAISLSQSSIVMVNPYFENITSSLLAAVGINSETTVKSSLIIEGGQCNITSPVIQANTEKPTIRVTGLTCATNDIVFYDSVVGVGSVYSLVHPSDVTTSPGKTGFFAQQDATNEVFYGNKNLPPYAAGGGVTFVTKRNWLEMSTSIGSRGINIGTGLTIGNKYTVVLAMRGTAGNPVLTGVGGSVVALCPTTAENWQVQYFPVTASAATIALVMNNTADALQMRLIAVLKGHKLPRFDAYATPQPIQTTVAPTTDAWIVGDRVQNSVPTVGQPKAWVCTVAGTPGTWVSEGNL